MPDRRAGLARSKRRRRDAGKRVQGILVLDKRPGLTSHDVVKRVRRIYGVSQVGHAGTLDPVASGVLVILVGSATRIAQYLQEDDKEYHLTMILGRETDTQDITGKTVMEKDPGRLTRDQFLAAVDRYRGEYLQTPPSFSAVKHRGQPLYRLARKGTPVTADPRKVTIYRIGIEDWQPGRASLKVVCSKGTYMRTLCHDIGRDLGVGGCMESLVRARSGLFSLEDCLDLEDLAAAEDPLAHLRDAVSGLPFPRYEAGDGELEDLLRGRTVPWSGPERGTLVSVTRDRWLLALGRVVVKDGKPFLAPSKILEAGWKELFKSEDK